MQMARISLPCDRKAVIRVVPLTEHLRQARYVQSNVYAADPLKTLKTIRKLLAILAR